MVHPASEFCIWLSLIGIIFTFFCLAECGKCPREEVRRPLDYDASTFVKGCCNGLQNSYSSYLSLDYSSGLQKSVPLDDNTCLRSESVPPSTKFGFHSESQGSTAGSLDINKNDSGGALHKQSIKSDSNVSLSSNDVVFRVPNGRTVTCSLNFREFDHEKLSSVNGADQTVVSSCRGHLLNHKKAGFSFWNIDLEKSPSSDFSPPHVKISPSKLNWGHQYLFHSSVASLSIKNICNESVLKVYEPFSTDSQFYPFNFSEVLLGPGEITSIFLAYLPSRLGLSSAEFILQTSFGGFLVEAKGFAVDSPYGLSPLVGLDASSGGWLTKKFSLLNPFSETIDLKEVAASFSVSQSSVSFTVDSICRKQNPEDSYKHSLSNLHKVSNGDSGQLDSVVMSVRPLSNWLITPHRTQNILEMTFSSDSERKFVGAVCMELFRSVVGEKDLLVLPFEAELKKTSTRKATDSPLSVSIEAVGPCDATETTISVSVRNMALQLLKVVRIEEVKSKRLLQIKYLDGLLLFPGTVSEVALVTYDPSSVDYDSFHKMPDVSMSWKLEIEVNDSVNPLLEVPCLDIIGVCPRRQQESLPYLPNIVDSSIRTEFLTDTEKSPVLTKVPREIEADEYDRKEWGAQNTVSRHSLLDKHELLFSLVPIGKYYAKTITVRNPSQQPVIVQLFLNSQETIDNCQTCYDHEQSPSSSSICNDSSRVGMHGFSVAESAITEVLLHPHATASLGPILFHPSNRCEWKSSAFIQSNLSGLELLSLQGYGGSLSLVMLEGSQLMQRLDFNLYLPSPVNESNNEDANSVCRKPLFKKLFAVNAGDFPVEVKRIDVSGRECGLDGFVVHHCRPFSLEPGESLELGLSYQSDFSVPIVRREIEFILAVGMLVIPMQASIPLDTLSLCSDSIFWEDAKRYFWFFIIFAILFYLLWFSMHSHSMDNLIKGEKKSVDDVRPEGKSSSILFHDQGNGKPVRSTKTSHMKKDVIAEHTDQSLDCRTKFIPSSDSVKEINFSSSLTSKSVFVKKADRPEVVQPVQLTVKTRNEKRRRSRKRNALVEVCSSQSGNSTPSSPLSPNTTLSPPETCSPSQEKMESHGSHSPKPVVAFSTGVPGNQIQNIISTQQQSPPGGVKKAASLAIRLPSASYPVTRLSPSRWAIAPEARAPGPKIRSQKTFQPEENRSEDRFVYDIWGNHLSGLHLCKPDSSVIINSGGIGHSNSFFLRGPQETLMKSCQPPCVSSFCDEG